ncbi:MAG: histidine kinase [Candidatus Saccharibacteria bacterium]|nr:histidine kinase [Candidatus Saccharibacteria bacterium]
MQKTSDNDYPFLVHDGEMGRLIAAFNWGKTDLGTLETWPQSLQTTTNIILQSDVPMVVLWGENGRMIYNDAYSVFAGARHPELLGSKVIDGWPEVADFNTNVMKVVLGGKKLSYANQELTLYRNNVAEIVWMDLFYSPIMDESGVPAGVLAVVIEITDRVMAEHHLASTKAKLDSALAVGLVSTWTWDIKKDIVTGDKNLARSFGISKKTLDLGLPLATVMQAIHEDDRERVKAAIEKKLKHNAVFEEEYRTVDYKGEIRWVIARGEFQKNSKGDPEFFIGILIDITERKEAQLDLEETKNKFDALFNSNIVAIAMAKTNGDILHGNKTFLELFGYSNKDFQAGLTSKQVTAPDSVVTSKGIYDSIKKTGEAEPTEKTYVRKDGTTFPAIVGAAKLPTSEDTFMAFIVDISENQRLKELNAAKDEFIALASHQLRTPASAVKQYLGVLLEEYAGPLSEEQLKYLTTANNANNRQLAIIDDLLKTAQIDTKGYNLALYPRDLVGIVKNVISQYESTLDARKQKVVLTTDKKEVIVPLDETEISICVANLIENASKYSQDGAIVKIELAARKNYGELTITDTGVGIAKKDQQRIFDKFTRVNNDMSDTVTGSGLGLYWVKRIVDIHKGEIKIHSTVGKGTSFTIRLPYEY